MERSLRFFISPQSATQEELLLSSCPDRRKAWEGNRVSLSLGLVEGLCFLNYGIGADGRWEKSVSKLHVFRAKISIYFHPTHFNQLPSLLHIIGRNPSTHACFAVTSNGSWAIKKVSTSRHIFPFPAGSIPCPGLCGFGHGNAARSRHLQRWGYSRATGVKRDLHSCKYFTICGLVCLYVNLRLNLKFT